MGVIKRVTALLLVLVMLSSAISPAMAANEGCPACGKNPANPNAKVAVIEVKGLEKNKALAKALKNEDVKKLMDELVKKEHKPELAKAVVSKIIGKYGEATYVFIPFKAKGCEAGIGYLISEKGSRAFAAEVSKEGEITTAKLYYVNADGNVVFTILSGDTDYWTCWAQCMVDQCMYGAIPSGLCDICWGLLDICLLFVPITWEACIAAAACFGGFSFYCGWQCS